MDDSIKSKYDMKVYDRNALAHKSGMTQGEVALYYTQWAEQYENDLCEGIYNGPTIIANEVASLYPSNRDQINVLDVAAGTGLLGEKLYRLGFRRLSALDPAAGMLDVCKKKNLYQEYICQFMDGKRLPIPDDEYDCIAISGGMGESHLPRAALTEMVRIVKPGGYICIVMRNEYLQHVTEYNNGKLESAMDDLEHRGKWRKVTRKIVQNYSFQKEGVVFVYQVT